MRRLPLLPVALLAAGLAAPRAAAGQSLLASEGLGLELQPMSARSAALGGVSLGLPGAEISWSNPAGAIGLPVGGMLASFQYDTYDTRIGDRSIGEGNTARLPLLLAAFPFGEQWAVSVGFGGFLDQRWGATQPDSLVLGTDSVRVLDVVRSDGGVSRLRVAASRRLVPGLSLGLGADVYTGGVRRVAGRIFPGESQPRCCTTTWRYSGVGAVGSLDWNPSEALSVSASLTAAGTLPAKTEVDTLDADEENDAVRQRDYDLPVIAQVGATGRVAPNLLVAATAQWGGWSSLDPRLVAVGGARDDWGVGAGLEWEALQLGARTIPIRLGARYRSLPFGSSASDDATPSERTFSLGTGLALPNGAARADVTVERGSRDGASDALSESFWRVVLSASVLGQ
jgi:hypothetical protein